MHTAPQDRNMPTSLFLWYLYISIHFRACFFRLCIISLLLLSQVGKAAVFVQQAARAVVAGNLEACSSESIKGG